MTTTRKGQFKAGTSGNPAGRPKGARGRVSFAIDKALEGKATALTDKAVELALGGDVTALRICMDRIAPVRRDRPITFPMPPIETTDDLAKAGRALLGQVATGEITPAEAGDVMKLFDGLARTIEVAEIERRLKAVEEGMTR